MTSDDARRTPADHAVFDISSMQPEDVQRAVDSAKKYVDEQMSPADLVAVATVGSTLDVLTDFTGDRDEGRRRRSATLAYTDGTATRSRRPPSTAATDEAAAAADDDAAPDDAPSSTCSTTTSACAR